MYLIFVFEIVKPELLLHARIKTSNLSDLHLPEESLASRSIVSWLAAWAWVGKLVVVVDDEQAALVAPTLR